MPARMIIATKIADLLGVLAHPHRIRVVEELALGEKDVRSLEQALSLSQSSVSQHLSLLRNHGLVKGRREGKHVVYTLAHSWLASWINQTIRFFEESEAGNRELKNAVSSVKKIWKVNS